MYTTLFILNLFPHKEIKDSPDCLCALWQDCWQNFVSRSCCGVGVRRVVGVHGAVSDTDHYPFQVVPLLRGSVRLESLQKLGLRNGNPADQT